VSARQTIVDEQHHAGGQALGQAADPRTHAQVDFDVYPPGT
jgi:hypothetical protein